MCIRDRYRGICDSQTRILTLDDELAELSGIDPANYREHFLASLVDPEWAPELLDCWVDSSALGASSCSVRLAGDTDDEERVFQATLIANGEQTNFIFVDATNNPRLQRSQDHRNRIETISEMVPQGIFRISDDGRLLYKNSKLDDIFGRELINQRDFADLVTHADEPVYKAIPRMLEELDDNECVVEISHDVDGTSRSIRVLSLIHI